MIIRSSTFIIIDGIFSEIECGFFGDILDVFHGGWEKELDD